MAIEITSRNKDIPASMQDYARGKAAAIEKEYPKTSSVKVVLDLDRHLYGAHFTATVDGFQFDAEASDSDNLAKAIDEAADKTDRQIRKQLDKIGDNRK
ncbi:MAG: ribosome-associated translation inhibitor RaiA [Kiritimatiellae bacterium]|nr:ribosome-associated translation inhibitor RaiA [Kiritimatiellia bacterium]